MLLAVRLVDLGTLVTLVVVDASLLTFAFFLFRHLHRTGGGYVPPDVELRGARASGRADEPGERATPGAKPDGREPSGAVQGPETVEPAAGRGHALEPA